MGHLTLVRHAQASFFGSSYDALSPLGETQAAALGRHWLEHGKAFGHAFVGPRRRHRHTYEIVRDIYRQAGESFPEAVELASLDEHHGGTVIKHALGRTDAHTDSLGGHSDETDPKQAIAIFFRHYNRIMREWARGALEVPDVETWPAFRERTLNALDTLCSGPDYDKSVAFTSGGVVSSAAGWLLGIDNERVIDLSIVLRNTGLTEISWSNRRRTLVSFNSLPHLPGDSAITSV